MRTKEDGDGKAKNSIHQMPQKSLDSNTMTMSHKKGVQFWWMIHINFWMMPLQFYSASSYKWVPLSKDLLILGRERILLRQSLAKSLNLLSWWLFTIFKMVSEMQLQSKEFTKRNDFIAYNFRTNQELQHKLLRHVLVVMISPQFH